MRQRNTGGQLVRVSGERRRSKELMARTPLDMATHLRNYIRHEAPRKFSAAAWAPYRRAESAEPTL